MDKKYILRIESGSDIKEACTVQALPPKPELAMTDKEIVLKLLRKIGGDK